MMRWLLATASLIATAATAAPTIDPMFGDNAVIQRDRPIRVRGTAAPGERLTVSLAGKSQAVRADKQGGWTAELPAMAAGGPHRLEVRGAGNSVAAANGLMIGDVWLCSGQSNMEWPLKQALNGEGEVAGANDPQLRLMKVPKRREAAPAASLAPDVRWQPTTPQSAAVFSAACYFMARRLRESHAVAIGAIDSTWGGTAIHSWMDDAGVRASGGAVDVELLREYRRDPKGTVAKFGNRWSQWWRDHSGDPAGQEPWHASDRLSWTAMPKIGLWESWGVPALADFNGAMWARVRFTLTPEQAAQGATLSLGPVDDFDRSFVNGEAVGQTFMYDKPREYAVRPGLLKAGENEVLLYILDTGGGGGIWGSPDALKLTLADGTVRPLGEGWQYSMIRADIGTPPLPPWDEGGGATVLYNGMIAPLGPIALKGVAWYQGEADVGKQNYEDRLAAWMKGWRTQFRDPELPFLIVGLAGFGQPATGPIASNWAALIDDQRKAAEADRHAALVPAIDIGERADIHPPNKQEVGRRLALAAEMIAYGNPKSALAPKLLGATRTGTEVVVRFNQPVQSRGGMPVGFELCGDAQGSCRYAAARAEGSTVTIAADGQPVTRVRYAWADYPIVNLYGPEMLPVPPFELPIK
ncbi:MAG TPA: sialate O-acetylesterase [Sphingomicrobium sp.]|nr:sialate O-acetylesterase [Sphingomicrobium sp.]